MLPSYRSGKGGRSRSRSTGRRHQLSTAPSWATAFTSTEIVRGGAGQAPPNLARMYSLGLETIAGSKLLQLKFGSAGLFQPDESVVHEGRRARFIGVHDGAPLVRHSGAS